MDEVTKAEDIALPVRVIELKYLKKRDGSPVKVLCEPVDELEIAKLYGMPGQHGTKVESDPLKLAEFLSQIAPLLIHQATAFATPDGKMEVRPAFHFDEEHAVQGSVPGRYLRMEEQLAIVTAILECSGVGGAAVEGRFLPGKREGGTGGVGAVADGEGNGQAAAPADAETRH